MSNRTNLPEWGTQPKSCDACHGTGIRRYIRTCGSFEPDPCPTCLGNGKVLEIVRLSVTALPSSVLRPEAAPSLPSSLREAAPSHPPSLREGAGGGGSTTPPRPPRSSKRLRLTSDRNHQLSFSFEPLR